VELLPERSSPSPARSQDVSTAITCPLSGGYHDSNQEIRDLEILHATRSDMVTGKELERDFAEDNSVEAQAVQYLQMIEDDVNEHMEVMLPGLLEDKRRVNKLHLVQSLYKEEGSGPGW
jgi:hypothetical protein